MPLPSYIPRSDSFGNWYFGGFQMDSAVEAGYGAGTGITATQSEFNTFLDSALGAGSWVASGTAYYFRINNSYEQLTGTVSTTANYRFALTSANVGVILNTAPTGTPITIGTRPNGTTFMNNFFSSLNCSFAVINQYGIWLAHATKGTTGTLGNVTSLYLGWVKDPVFPTNTTERVRNLIVGVGKADLNNAFLATRAPSTNTVPSTCFTNSVITCSVSTPGANTTDLCVLDSATSYLNIGSLYNSVFVPGSSLTIGQIYKIPSAQDPDGNTEQNIWLCAEKISGWNGSSQVTDAGYKLIRVWSNNIT